MVTFSDACQSFPLPHFAGVREIVSTLPLGLSQCAQIQPHSFHGVRGTAVQVRLGWARCRAGPRGLPMARPGPAPLPSPHGALHAQFLKPIEGGAWLCSYCSQRLPQPCHTGPADALLVHSQPGRGGHSSHIISDLWSRVLPTLRGTTRSGWSFRSSWGPA